MRVRVPHLVPVDATVNLDTNEVERVVLHGGLIGLDEKTPMFDADTEVEVSESTTKRHARRIADDSEWPVWDHEG